MDDDCLSKLSWGVNKAVPHPHILNQRFFFRRAGGRSKSARQGKLKGTAWDFNFFNVPHTESFSEIFNVHTPMKIIVRNIQCPHLRELLSEIFNVH